jgi:hypothetical protein
MKTILPLFLLIFLYSACTNKNESRKKASVIRKNHLIDSISKKYDAVANLDTLQLETTLQFQNLLSENEKMLINHFKVLDVEKNDSGYVISIEYGEFPKVFIRLNWPANFLGSSLNELISKVDDYVFDKCLIVRINKIKKLKLTVDYLPDDDENESKINIDSAIEDTFLAGGEILDIVTIPK